MLAKILTAIFSLLILSHAAFAIEEKADVMVKKDAASASANVEELLTLNGLRQAITTELLKNNLDSEAFWKKLDERNLSDADEILLLRPRFNSVTLAMTPVPAAPAPVDPFLRGVLTYDLDPLKVKVLFNEIAANLPDPAIKTFYIVPEIMIAKEMSWSDVGVAKEENFSGVIIESWKKWAQTQFKNFTNIVILEKDFVNKPENLNPESVTLKWNSFLKKGEEYPDRKSARFDLSAQYVLVNSKSGQSMVAFDFPNQKREFTIYNPKELSSNLASLVYNLLNSQTAKIASNLELNQKSAGQSSVEIKVVGKHGLFDITQINSFLAERFKDINLTSELKSYANENSVITIKSTQAADALYAVLGKEGGKWPLSEQKILLFSSENRTFAIIPKEANN